MTVARSREKSAGQRTAHGSQSTRAGVNMTARVWVVLSFAAVACGGRVDAVPADGGGPHPPCHAHERCIVDPPPMDPAPYDPYIVQPLPEPKPPVDPFELPKKQPPQVDPSKPVLFMGWTPYPFSNDRAESACAGGARFVQQSPRYAKWVGVELCSATRYKIYLGETPDGAFHELTDWAGGGQDHCELVNPNFTIPNEDVITSGGCTSCAYESGFNTHSDVPVYDRGLFRTPFELIAWPAYNHYTARWYECGVSIP